MPNCNRHPVLLCTKRSACMDANLAGPPKVPALHLSAAAHEYDAHQLAAGTAGAGLQHLADCVRVRTKLRSALLQHAPPESQAGLQALHNYLADTQQRCRGRPAAAEASTAARGSMAHVTDASQHSAADGRAAHTAVVHAVQSRHAADPHLQAEWAAILVAEGRLADAMQHYQVGTMRTSPWFLPTATIALN